MRQDRFLECGHDVLEDTSTAFVSKHWVHISCVRIIWVILYSDPPNSNHVPFQYTLGVLRSAILMRSFRSRKLFLPRSRVGPFWSDREIQVSCNLQDSCIHKSRCVTRNSCFSVGFTAFNYPCKCIIHLTLIPFILVVYGCFLINKSIIFNKKMISLMLVLK
jgi:hypothetical protein